MIFFILLLTVNFFNLDPVVGQRPENQIARARKIGRLIAEEAQGTRFNLSLISPTMDFRAMNYRYFTEIFGARAEGFENYSEIEFLYLITEQGEIEATEITSWELSSFGPAEIVDEWWFEWFEDEGIKIEKLKKKNDSS